LLLAFSNVVLLHEIGAVRRLEVQGKVVWVSLLLHAGIDPQVEVDQGVDLEGKLDLEILCESSRDWRFPQVNFQFKVLGIFFFLGHFLVELLYLGLGHYLLSGLDLVNWNHELLGYVIGLGGLR